MPGNAHYSSGPIFLMFSRLAEYKVFPVFSDIAALIGGAAKIMEPSSDSD
jgi:hypothetical protein